MKEMLYSKDLKEAFPKYADALGKLVTKSNKNQQKQQKRRLF
jgi:hypothetical protein